MNKYLIDGLEIQTMKIKRCRKTRRFLTKHEDILLSIVVILGVIGYVKIMFQLI